MWIEAAEGTTRMETLAEQFNAKVNALVDNRRDYNAIPVKDCIAIIAGLDPDVTLRPEVEYDCDVFLVVEFSDGSESLLGIGQMLDS